MTNSHFTLTIPQFITLNVECLIPARAVEPIIALTKAFGAKPANINGAGVSVRALPTRLAELFEACVREVAGVYSDEPTPQIHLF